MVKLPKDLAPRTLASAASTADAVAWCEHALLWHSPDAMDRFSVLPPVLVDDTDASRAGGVVTGTIGRLVCDSPRSLFLDGSTVLGIAVCQRPNESSSFPASCGNDCSRLDIPMVVSPFTVGPLAPRKANTMSRGSQAIGEHAGRKFHSRL